MKKLSIILPMMMIFCFIVGCQDKAAIVELEKFKGQAAVEKSNRALAERYVDAYSRGDIEALKGILSPEYIVHNQSEPAGTLEQFLRATEERKKMFPDGILSIEDLLVKEDKIVWRAIFRGTHTENFEGFGATGKEVEAVSIAILRIKDEKIVESWGILDFLTLYQQLGFELKPPEAKK